ncbi:MAG: hypothetical protein HUN05_16180 [Desulfobacter sp.]|nr:MAG: hypothetical protein HUN05_16180 [Desulfobacter sp.]
MMESSVLSHQKTWIFLLIIFILFTWPDPSCPASRVNLRLGNLHFGQNTLSLNQIRWNNITRQGWDVSCGAAALSTLLTFHHHKKFSEMAITLTILKNSDPARIKARGEFSLYDLKRFAKAVGYEGLGFADMSVDDLEFFDLPAILPFRMKELDHFVVFKKKLGNHILLGDPAFGNLSLPLKQFESLWKSRIAFYVANPEEKTALMSQTKTGKLSPLAPKAMEATIPFPDYVGRMVLRIPMVPLTRKKKTVSPIQ